MSIEDMYEELRTLGLGLLVRRWVEQGKSEDEIREALLRLLDEEGV